MNKSSILVIISALCALNLGGTNALVEYGAVCNGVLQQCHRYSETVLCMNRQTNSTIGGETCETGLGVNVGRCQCRRNCAANGTYIVDGEFDQTLQKCVGFVGKSCQIYPDCTYNASCEPVMRVCRCNDGFQTSSDGLRCVPRFHYAK